MSKAVRSILLVEDNRDDAELTLRSLKEGKVANDVTVTRDGAEALEYLHGDPTRPLPTMVVLDLNLPKIDGLAVLRRIREHPRTRGLPVVVLTSSTEDSDVMATYELGVNSYVRKPVNIEDFARAAAQLGLYWTILNIGGPAGRSTE